MENRTDRQANPLAVALALRARTEIEVLQHPGKAQAGDILYQLRRVHSGAMRQLGVVALMGGSQAADIMKEAQTLMRQRVDPNDPLAKAEAAARAANAQQLDERLMRLVFSNPDSLKAIDEHDDALLCSGIEGGKVREYDGQPWSECEFYPLQFVPRQEDEDPGAGLLWVGSLSSEARSILVAEIRRISSGADEVRPFRPSAGSAGADRHDG